ncbi:MAG: BMP family ABC transporter substrate-binding protein [Acidimicrobiia bacterium]|nr:BMP family ABC transporter substrate-binding protein [Acidimicrobiia bacterium]
MLKSRRFALVALLAAFALVVAACGDDDDAGTTTQAPTTTAATTTTTTAETTTTTAAATTTTAAPTTTTTLPPPPPEATVLACQVSDTGGIDDKSFNEKAWKGAQDAQAKYPDQVEIEFLESQSAADFQPNIEAFIAQGCDLITTVGFLLAEATANAAAANPDQLFAIIDQAPGPFPPWTDGDGNSISPNDWQNLRGIQFATDEAAFLAGWVGAAISETGVVGTFGGINIPPVTVFMDGFVQGVEYYNQVNGTEVVALGWDVAEQDGLFTGNFESLEDGRAFAQNLVDEGADVVLTVAGPVGLGSAAFCQETGACVMIGVDADQAVTAPEFEDTFVVSIEKNMDVAVLNTIENVLVLDAVGNDFLGTLTNGGVGLSEYHGGVVPEDVQAAAAQLEADIIAAGGLAAFLAANAGE